MFLNQLIPPPFLKNQAVIFFGGNINLNPQTDYDLLEKPFDKLPVVSEADVRIINLGCEPKDANESELYYLRLKQNKMLIEAGIDVALTAHNNSRDFEQIDYLDRAGILHCGTGKNIEEASRPLFVKVNEIIVALFNVYAVSESLAATDDLPGIFYLPHDKPELWRDFFTEKISDARRKADVVLVSPHWEIDEQIKDLGRLLIDCGADAVLGCHSHLIQGVETYKSRPIIYDAGDFFVESELESGGGYSLVISKRGVEQIYFVPLHVEQNKISPTNINDQFLDSCRELNSEIISCRSDLFELKYTPPSRADQKLEPVELSGHGARKIQLQKSAPLISNNTGTLSGDFDIEEFKREFKAHNGEICIMVLQIKPRASGLELSAFRRARLFRKYFDLKVNIVTHEYQNDILEQRDDYELDVNVLNMYDYFQEIDRAKEKPRMFFVNSLIKSEWKVERLERDWRILQPDGTLVMYCVFSLKDRKLNFINFFNKDRKKIQRDIYDSLGFLSRRQILEPATEHSLEEFYYRPDGSLAIHETYKFVNDKKTLICMEIINRKGEVTKTFTKFEDARAYWFVQMFKDRSKTYFLIGDRSPDWHKVYIDAKSFYLDNVRVIHQMHNVHVYAPFDPLLSKLNPRYDYLWDAKIKSDVILSLTTRQRADVIKRYNPNNVIVLPHSLAAVPRVTDVKLDPFKIIQVGRIVEEKGQKKAVEAMKIVLKKVPEATLHFYGRGALQGKLQEIIDENNLGEHIKIEGFSENMPAEFASAAMSILPSTFEGFPLVIQESMQQGCPVVAFDCNYGPADGIEDGVNGYLVPVDDIEALADRIIKVLSEPGLRQKFSENSLKSVEKFYPEVVASQWAELFFRLMQTN